MASCSILFLFAHLSASLVLGHFIPGDKQSPVAIPPSCKFGPDASPVADLYEPLTRFETYGEGLDVPSSFIGDSLHTTAVAIVQDKLGLPDGQVIYTSGYSAETADYAYLKQSYNGVPFVNAVANLVLKSGKVVSFGSSFVDSTQATVASSYPSIKVNHAIRAAEHVYQGVYNQHPTKLEYYVQKDGLIALVYTVQIQNDDTDTWVEAYVDAHSGAVLGSTNFIAEAGYRVVPLERQSILDGSVFVKDPQDTDASPQGWHQEYDNIINETAGNNVVAFIKIPSETSKASEPDLVFQYLYDTLKDPEEDTNPDAARTNAFYVINSVHDIAYRYGFTEKSFNFQTNNFGKGGKEGDRVLMMVQNDEKYNNAVFGTPPDGQSGICKMFIWTKSDPYRDGDLDNSVIVHEMTHGITNRMTGGGTAKCLQSIESKGMGEGWSDILADWTEQTSAFTQDFTVGRYVTTKAGGTREYPYSVDPEVNPLKYSNLNKATGQHAAGQIWANILHNIYAALVKKHGYSTTARTNPNGKEGNVVFLHLLIDGLAGQPCYPKFADARDAWIQADENRYDGENKCLLWNKFASRGLGMDAKYDEKSGYIDGYDVPSDCKDA
ncbi:metallo proteinase 10 [Crepidotus variabilis]|uniref:Extracellular metalloproteinase n=1 Tax=Crepidotus variabilis TaxID=179855 RepID=A0A9P6EBN2_9AGAR|nr:metallo proteinase 10 [Crepidotus variabilis]